jgi:transcriptional adapter 2-alpha
MFKIEPVKAIRVYELLLANGWVKDGGGGGGGTGGGGAAAAKKEAEEEDGDGDDAMEEA